MRVQSPSSINTYKQCPRRYYYSYIEKLPTKPSIHLIRGKVVHSVLEDFYDVNPVTLDECDEKQIRNKIQVKILRMLEKEWKKNADEFAKLDLSELELKHYKDDTRMMLLRFAEYFFSRLKNAMDDKKPSVAFASLIPTREQRYISQKLMVQGFVDVIEEGKLIDYKTSNKGVITPEYRLQLAIYSVLYNEKHGKPPEKVGIYFLKHDPNEPVFIDVDEGLMKDALFEIEQIHFNTKTNDKEDYPMKPGPLCKYSTGQCDFYDKCFG